MTRLEQISDILRHGPGFEVDEAGVAALWRDHSQYSLRARGIKEDLTFGSGYADFDQRADAQAFTHALAQINRGGSHGGNSVRHRRNPCRIGAAGDRVSYR